MKIKHVIRSSFIDYPTKSSCIIFLFGCPLRCGFCYNPGLVLLDDSEDLSEEKILDFLEKRRGVLDAVVFTGGEPLMTLDKAFVQKVKNMGFLVKIDTNGMYPDRLLEFVKDGLVDYVAMDLKCEKEKYSEVAGVDVDISKIEESMLIVDGVADYEFRTTVVPGIHDENSIRKIGEWVGSVISAKPKKYFLQGFQNNGDFIDKKYGLMENIFPENIKPLKEMAQNYFVHVGIRG